MGLSIAREIAYDAFAAAIRKNKKPEDYLEVAYSKAGKKLKRLDRAFIKELVYGSLRWHAKLYWILQNTSHRDLEKASDEIVAALVCGTYQIYYMDKVPDRAAVNESVEYMRRRGQTSACSFVNGILRQIANRAQYFPKPDKEKEPNAYLALQYSHPRWMVDRWLRHFKFDRLAQMLASNNTPPPITIRCNLLKTPLEQAFTLQEQLLREENIHSDKCSVHEGFKLKTYPKLGPESAFAQGLYLFQDEASQLIGRLVAPKPGEVIFDLCSGPGGKLSHIYELAKGEAKITAIERDSQQLAKAQQNMIRLGHENVQWFHGDCAEFQGTEKADKVLLDAPCSGMGVLRRHPEGKWHKTEEAIPRIAKIQRKLIEHALELLKPGGELIYSVCSFEPEESSEHLAYLTEKYNDKIVVVSPQERLPNTYGKYVTQGTRPMLLVFPGNSHEMDGFAAFIVKKT